MRLSWRIETETLTQMLELCYGYFISDNHKLMEEKSTRKDTVTEKSSEDMCAAVFIYVPVCCRKQDNSFCVCCSGW